MKTIYLIRHAKAIPEHSDMPDEKRTLVEEGIEQTEKICDYLSKNRCKCQHIYTSNAVRSLETARILAKGFKSSTKEIIIEPRLYSGTTDAYLDVLYRQPKEVTHLAIVGHNPNVTDFANCFLSEMIHNLPTSAVLCIEIDTDNWTDIDLATHRKRFLITPKTL